MIQLPWKGLLLCTALGAVAYGLGMYFPLVGGPVFAILLGMVIASTVGTPADAKAGITYSSKKVLQYAVILLGFGLNLAQIAKVSLMSLPIIVSTITVALGTAYILCKALSLPQDSSILISVGSSICGGSAIAATAPVIKASDEDIAKSISVIFLFNVMAALLFPTLGQWLGMSHTGFAIFAGTAINDTSSVTAAASIWDELHPGAHTLDYAAEVKLTRTLAIIPITLVLSIYMASKNSTESGFSLSKALPRFIIYFLLASTVTTVASFLGLPMKVFSYASMVSKFFITIAMGAIGLSTNISALIKTGPAPFVLGGACWLAIMLSSIAMQYIMGLL